MTNPTRSRRLVSAVLVAALTLVQMPAGLAAAAEGGPIATSDAVEQPAAPSTAEKRAAVTDFLEREDVAQALAKRGVDPAEAKARVAGLSQGEVERLYGVVADAPAGGVIGEVISAGVFIFVLLLVTDILGYTDVFPFTNSINE